MPKRAAATLFLTVAFFQMALCQDVEEKRLQCYFCAYEQACAENLVQCKEGERCGTMLGHSDYKVHESIFGKGCISASKCGNQDQITYWRNPFRVTYSCCDTDFCNKESFGADQKGIAAAGHTSIPAHLPWLFAATLLAALPALLS
uniref:sperm acrosome membrane-associated protein 4-like n=1 Tax=Euleptes europaea TaxID=460621 RepID=UPI00254203AE|nr:sperm acrosome membrane-associated protein 4-like [Euleptes europaea]